MIVKAMMIPAFLALLLFAGPYWEAKAPADWTPEELQRLLTDSPWAATNGTAMFLATARPMRLAEEQARLRSKPANAEMSFTEEEYREFLRTHDGKVIVLAVDLPDRQQLADAEETRRMERDSFLKAGRKKLRMIGHFPPSDSDPFLRLVFPREVDAKARGLIFEIYLPSVTMPYRMIEFRLKDMVYQGRLEM
jgi:hypothetical protein